MDLNATRTNLHIIVTRDGIVLTRRDAATFRDFQDQYQGFMTSFGPLDRDGVLDTFEYEWPDLLAINHDAIRTFTKGLDPAQSELRIVMNGGPP